MTMRSGLFDSKTIVQTVDGYPQGDRAEMADFFAKYFSAFIGNGVYPNPSTNFQVMAYDQMTVEIQPGLGFINGYFCWDTKPARLSFQTDSQPHTYRVILRLSLRTRFITLETLADNLDLTRNDTVWEIALADIKVKANQIIIGQSDISDLRLNSKLCGIVHGVVDQIDTTTIGNQLQGWIDSYMERTKIEYNLFLSFLQNLRNQSSEAYQNLIAHFVSLETQSDGEYQKLLDYFNQKKTDADSHYETFYQYVLNLKVTSQEEYLKFLAWLETFKQEGQDSFQEWFDTVKGIMGADEAGKLLLLIQELQAQQPTGYINTIEHNKNGYPHCDLYTFRGFGNGMFGSGKFGETVMTTVPAKFAHSTKNSVAVYSLPEFNGTNEVVPHENNFIFHFSEKDNNLYLILR